MAHHAGTSEEARLSGEGIGDMLPRSSMLGLEDEGTVPGDPCSILPQSLRRKPLNIERSGLEISSMQGRGQELSNSI